MSVISNIHTAVPYDAKKSVAFTDQRLVVTIAKKDKSGNYGPHLQQTMCTSIPTLTEEEITDALNTEFWQEQFFRLLQQTQNDMIGDRIKEGQKTITTEELGIATLQAYLESVATGDRWDVERVTEWFITQMAGSVEDTLKERNPSWTEEQVTQAVVGYGKVVADNLGSKANIPTLARVQIRKVLALWMGEENDPIIKRFVKRLDDLDARDAKVTVSGL